MKLFIADCYDDDYVRDTYIMVDSNEVRVYNRIMAKNYCYSEIKVNELDIVDGYKVKLERVEE